MRQVSFIHGLTAPHDAQFLGSRSSAIGAPASAHRSHRPSAEDVEMEVEHDLSARLATVDDLPVACVGDALLARQPGGDDQHPAEQTGVLAGRVIEGRQMILGDHQEVDRRDGVDIVERQQLVVLEELLARDLTGYDLAKDAAWFGQRRPPILVTAYK